MALEDAFQPGSGPAPAPDDDAAPEAPAEGTEGTAAPPTPYSSPQPAAGTALTPDARDYVDRMASAGYSAEQISGGLGVHSYESGGNLSPTAINPTSGAAGIAQDLGPRRAGLLSYLNENGLQPTVANETDYNIRELGGPEAAADQQIRGAKTVEDASYAWSHHFERPGPDGEAKEIPYAIRLGNQALPLVQARLAELKGGGGRPSGAQLAEAGGVASDASNTPTASASKAAAARDAADPDYQRMLQQYQQTNGPVGGGKFDNDKVPAAGVAAPGNSIQDMWGQYQKEAADKARAADASPQNKAQEIAAKTGELWGTTGHALSSVPNLFLRGFVADVLGLPGDIVHSVTEFYNQHPALATMIGQEGVGVGGTGYENLPAGPGLVSQEPGKPDQPIPPGTPLGNYDPKAVVDPNGKGAHPLPTTEDMRKFGEYATGLDLRNPAEKGDMTIADNLVGNAAEFIGMGLNPLSWVMGGPEAVIAREGSLALRALKTTAKIGNDYVVLPGGLSMAPDLAGAATGALGGTEGEQKGAKLALTTALVGAGARAALMEKGENALIGGASALRNGAGGDAQAASGLDQAFKDTYPESAFGPDRWKTEKAAAVDHLDQYNANSQLASGLPPAGTVAPHPTLADAFSGDEDLRHSYGALPATDQQQVNSLMGKMVGQYKVGGAADSALADQQQALLDKGSDLLQQRVAVATNGAVPPGYIMPGALQTASAPIRQMFINNLMDDHELNNPFVTTTKPMNMQAMEGMRPEGDAEDAAQAVRNMLTAQQTNIDTRISLAKQKAEQAQRIATMDGRFQQGDLNAEFDLAQEYVNRIRDARNAAFATADQSWDVARQNGWTSATTAAAPMYQKLENLIGQNVKMSQGANFPYGIINDLYKDGNPQGMFDKLGTRKIPTMGSGGMPGPNALYGDAAAGGQTSLEQLKSIDSRLGNAIRMEQDAISSPGNRGNPALLRNLNQVRDAVWGTIKDGASQDGQLGVSLASAMNATAAAHRTFGDGLIGQLLTTNSSGENKNIPAQLLASYLGNTHKSIQAARTFMQVMEQRTGAAAARVNLNGVDPATGLPTASVGATPSQQMHSFLADYLRQSYLNSRGELGSNGGTKWLQLHQPLFNELQGQQIYSNLHKDLMSYNSAADHELPEVEAQAGRDRATIENSAAQLFLGGEAGPTLDAVFAKANRAPGASMQQLIDATRQDTSGNAFRGLQAMVFDRLMTAATKRDQLDSGTYYSGAKAKAFMEANAPAFNALRRADPLTSANLDTIVNAMVAEDAARVGTGLRFSPQTQQAIGPGMGGDIANALTRYIGARAGHALLQHSSIQGPAIGANLASKWIGQPISRMMTTLRGGGPDPLIAAHSALRDAMFDPQKLRALLSPASGGAAATLDANGLSVRPWQQSLAVGLGQTLTNPPPVTPQQDLQGPSYLP